jgi:hypothetical protein
MKKTQIFYSTFYISLFISFASAAQKKLNLTVKFDKEFERYEVFVKPNFSERNFTWGPSQISLVLPSNVLIEKIKISNVDGGTWEDNSVIQAPEISPENSFHGIASGGDKTDIVEGYESVLFYFTLPKNVNSDKVRVFDNELDPKSDANGMMGGDFRNTIVDKTGKDWFSEAYKKEMPRETTIKEELADFEAIVYPNVIIENKFKVSLKNIKEEDGDVLMILSNDLGKELLRQKGSKSNLEKQIVNLPTSISTQGLIVKFITSKGSISKRLLTEN